MRRNLMAGLVVAGLALPACAEEVPVEQRLAAAQEATTAPGTARVALELTHRGRRRACR